MIVCVCVCFSTVNCKMNSFRTEYISIPLYSILYALRNNYFVYDSFLCYSFCGLILSLSLSILCLSSLNFPLSRAHKHTHTLTNAQHLCEIKICIFFFASANWLLWSYCAATAGVLHQKCDDQRTATECKNEIIITKLKIVNQTRLNMALAMIRWEIFPV